MGDARDETVPMNSTDIEVGLWERYAKVGHDLRADILPDDSSKLTCDRCQAVIHVEYNRVGGYKVSPSMSFLDVACQGAT
jgi:hypothetical protein